MFRKLAVTGLITLAILAGAAEAKSCCYDDCGWSGTYIGAEWLYLRSYGVDQSFFIRDDEFSRELSTSDSELRCVQPDYSSGVRVWLGYQDPCSCWGLRGSYLYFDSSGGASLSGTGVSPQGVVGASYDVDGHSSVDYQKVSFELTGELTSCNCPFALTGFVGLGWAEVTHNGNSLLVIEDMIPSTTEIYTANRSYFSGLGPRAGLDLVWEMPCYSCIALRATLATNLLAAKTKANAETETVFIRGTTPPPAQVSRAKLVNCYRLFPSFEAKVGLQGTWACGCTEIVAEIGYRADYYTNALDVPNSLGNQQVFNAAAAEIVDGQVFDGGGNRTLRNDVGFGGLYLGAQVGF